MFYNSQGGTQYSSVYSQGGAGSISWKTTIPTPSLFWPFNGSNVDVITGLSPKFSSVDNGTTSYLPTYVSGISGQQAIYFNNNSWISPLYPILSNIAFSSTGFNFNSNNFSSSLWVNFSQLGSGPSTPWSIQYNISQTYLQIVIDQNPTIPDAYVKMPSSKSTSSGNLLYGTWYNITAVYSNVGAGVNNTTAYLYVNGTFTSSVTGGVPTNFSGDIQVGGSAIRSTYAAYSGAMQNLRLWNRALTAAQVLAIYNAM